ncbi:MAG TPA: preprotein translocase subunit SecG [Rhodanobacteraceae bacterium]|nr:preprotein translocase subunit SecG [Rhodanobacteraceae bacterium]
MLSIITNVFFVLIAVAMTALILMQRGAGADAGSGFGGGASATVFGARGSANFLSRSTAVLAGLFFLISLGMAIYAGRPGPATNPAEDLGVMADEVAPAPAKTAPAGDSAVPQATPPVSPDRPRTDQDADKSIPLPTGTPTPATESGPAATGPATTAAKPTGADGGKPAADKPKDGNKDGQ